jgi:periplasmic divalent cation tolerance protein
MSELRVLVTTFPSAEKAESVAQQLVQQRLAACVNLLPGVKSIYSWKGELCSDTEVMALIKTNAAGASALMAALAELHPYEVPEMLLLTPEQVSASYEAWVLGHCSSGL